MEIKTESELCSFLIQNEKEIQTEFRKNYIALAPKSFQSARIKACLEIAKRKSITFSVDLLKKTIRK